MTVPVFHIILCHLQCLHAGGVGALVVGATEVGQLHVLASSSYLGIKKYRQYFIIKVANLTLKVSLQNTAGQIFFKPSRGRLRLPPAPSLGTSEVIELRNYPVKWLSHHVDQIWFKLMSAPVKTVEMTVKNQRFGMSSQKFDHLDFICMSQDLFFVLFIIAVPWLTSSKSEKKQI